MTTVYLRRLCDVCSDSIDPDESAHIGHTTGCARVDCACDLWWHPECCPDCQPDRMEVE